MKKTYYLVYLYDKWAHTDCNGCCGRSSNTLIGIFATKKDFEDYIKPLREEFPWLYEEEAIVFEKIVVNKRYNGEQ